MFNCLWANGLSMEFSRQDSGVGCHALLQRIFPTPGLNTHLLHLHLLCCQAGFFFFLTTSSTWEALWSPLLTDKQMETRGEKPHPWQRVCLGSAANRLCDLFPLAGYLWFISSAVQWMSWTRILVNSGRKVLDSNIPSIFCRFCGLLPEEQVRWLSEFHSACQPIW